MHRKSAFQQIYRGRIFSFKSVIETFKANESYSIIFQGFSFLATEFWYAKFVDKLINLRNFFKCQLNFLLI